MATYGSASDFSGSASAGAAHTVNPAATTTTITNAAALAATPAVVGESYAVNWAVAVTEPGAGTPTGTMTVSGGSGCSAAVAVGTCSVMSTTAGAKTLVATYAGDTDFTGSASAGAAHTVNKAGTATSVSSSSNPSVFGSSVTFTGKVSVNPPGAGTPGGTVQFKIDAVSFGLPVPVGSRVPAVVNTVCASISTSSLTVP